VAPWRSRSSTEGGRREDGAQEEGRRDARGPEGEDRSPPSQASAWSWASSGLEEESGLTEMASASLNGRPCWTALGVLVMAVSCVVGCSEMHTHKSVRASEEIAASVPYRVYVQAGHLSPVVYELALNEFAGSLPIAENADPVANGRIEIVFSSSTESAFIASTGTTGSGSTWYSAGHASGTSTAVSSTTGGTFDWQNSTMLVTIKDAHGSRLWNADYRYKGGWELSGWTVNTPEEAARLCLRRIHKRLLSDLGQR